MDLSEFWAFSVHQIGSKLRTDTGSNVETTEKEVPATAEHSVAQGEPRHKAITGNLAQLALILLRLSRNEPKLVLVMRRPGFRMV